MSRWSEGVGRVDGFLGRLLFRMLGLICAAIAVGTAYAAWNHFSAGRPYGWTPVILFLLAAIASSIAVPFCFSRQRTFGEVLDAMEDSTPDMTRRDPR